MGGNENEWDTDRSLHRNRGSPRFTIVKDSFFSNLKYRIGDESKIRFWKNPWIQSDYFFLIFPRLYSLCLKKNTLINRIHSTKRRNFRFKRNLNYWKVKDFTSMLLELEGVKSILL